MARAVAFDMSRLWLASLRDTPRGIERVDVACARQLCRDWEGDVLGLSWTPWGLRVYQRRQIAALLDHITLRWAEQARATDDPIFAGLRSWLLGHGAHVPLPAAPELLHKLSKVRAGWGCLRSVGLAPGRGPLAALPQGAIYLNVGHIGFAALGIERLLRLRPDLKTVAVIHDTISLTDPQFFPPGNLNYFENILSHIISHSDLVLTTTATGCRETAALITKAGGCKTGMVVGTMDMEAVFEGMPDVSCDSDLRQRPYFVICGTREPRKNHISLLNIWRRLASLPSPPKLVMVGGHGWGTEDVDDMFERCEPIRQMVARVEQLGSPGLFTLVKNARALLAPSLAEGYGLPLVEALRLGTPVIASNIEIFVETTQQTATLIDPLDGRRWHDCIAGLARQASLSVDQQRELRDGFVSKRPTHKDLLGWLKQL